jgi:hypothetical protein
VFEGSSDDEDGGDSISMLETRLTRADRSLSSLSLILNEDDPSAASSVLASLGLPTTAEGISDLKTVAVSICLLVLLVRLSQRKKNSVRQRVHDFTR